MKYHIRDLYTCRQDNLYSNEAEIKDLYQREVYEKALGLALMNGFASVLDIGCGHGFKLMKYFREFESLGLDLPPTVKFLQEHYPEKRWGHIPLDSEAPVGFDLVIAADVIEHLVDPDQLLGFIERAAPKLVVLSTPDRNLFEPAYHRGPPSNWCHVREWAFEEFESYIAEHLDVIEHFHSNRGQKTQCIVARLKAA